MSTAMRQIWAGSQPCYQFVFKDRRRRGAIAMLMAFLVPVIVLLGAMAINIAYMELIRTEQMVATDAAARAAGRAMSFYQDVDSAMLSAQTTAALNKVAGQPMSISVADAQNQVEFGDASLPAGGGRYQFTKIPTAQVRAGTQVADSVRVNSAEMDLPLLFPMLNGNDKFNMAYSSVAMQVDRDIALVLDRSGSMGSADFDWPYGVSPWSSESIDAGLDEGILYVNGGYLYYSYGQNWFTYYTYLWEEYYEYGDHPGTYFDQLVAAVDVFLSVLEQTDQSELVSLTTYSTSSTQDLTLKAEADYDDIRNELASKSPYGWTAIGEGIQSAEPTLTDAVARVFAAKTIIVMTDGVHNTGVSPAISAAAAVAAMDVTIHTSTVGDGADISAMQNVADIGGGIHYHADDAAALQAAFEEIANNLPTIVTK